MDAIKLSICKDTQDPIEPFEAVLDSFVRTQHKQVDLHIIPWDNYKQEMTAMALYGQGVHVSQVGAPVVNDLVAMNSLRPFTRGEVGSFGDASTFVPVAWNRMLESKEGSFYALPWIVDPRAIVFWRDMLEEAGVNEATAFTSFENMEQTFEQLQAKGYSTPWAVATADKLNAFQGACTWIWGHGGDIGNANNILFDRPEAIEGLLRYFSLYRFTPQAGRNPGAREIGDWFYNRKIAALIGSPPTILFENMLPAVKAKLGVSLAPGPSYVGGSSLIVWRNAPDPDGAVALARHLTSHEVQLDFSRRTGFLPARSSALNDKHFKEDPHLGVFVQSVFQGRTYENLRLSGLIEDMLANAISNVWRQIIADPQIEIKPVLIREIEPIARRARLLLE